MIGFACLLIAGLVSAPMGLAAQGYPDKPVKIVVPFSAGGGGEDEWVATMEALDGPLTPVNTLDRLLSDLQVRSNNRMNLMPHFIRLAMVRNEPALSADNHSRSTAALSPS